MGSIGIEELKKIQLDVLTAIHTFCVENNIVYSMACGTLLGAIRHGGYIPWDDDIDIYLRREDYNKLINLFPIVYKDRYKLVSLERDDKWDRPYSKAYDDKTILKEFANTNMIIGVGIDIYPIDKVPDDDKEWLGYNKKRRFLQYLLNVKYMCFSRQRSLSKNALLLFAKILLVFWDRRKIACFISKYSQKYNKRNANRVFECVQGLLQKRPFSANLFEDIIILKFEDREYCSFKNYDEYLTNGYGDYMQLPPEEKRVTHHNFQAYWKD